MPTLEAAQARLFERFESLGLTLSTHEHERVFTVEESAGVTGHLPGGHCKSLFMKSKKGALFLVVVLGESRVDMNGLSKALDQGRLSFGKPELLHEVLGVTPGSVTPFALINDQDQNQVTIVLEKRMMAHDVLNYHPLSNDATTVITPDQLVTFIESCGHRPVILEVPLRSE